MLSQEEKDRLLRVAGINKILFREMLLEMLRLDVMTRTGNVRAWKIYEQEQERNLKKFLRELEDEKKLEQLHTQLKSM